MDGALNIDQSCDGLTGEPQHIVSVSGGKDSASCYLLAIMRGRPFRAVTADTGHENEITYEWISKLSARTGGPEVEIVKADFTARIAHKRQLVQTKWVSDGMPDEIIQAALDILHPTGIPFLDLCIWKGRFPSIKGQFCTEHLKAEPIFEQVFVPAMASQGNVISWQGERRQGERRGESQNRSQLPRHQRVRYADIGSLHIWRPILHWSAENTFALHDHFGLEPNPLYRMGMGRVGCFPCINARKGELSAIFARFPEVLEKIRHFELLVSKASKRGQATFFAASTTPQGKRLAEDHKRGLRLDEALPGIDDIEAWSRTTRGGRQFDGFKLMDGNQLCSSQYGLCE
ncbi:phosphoadenosine phosphosulfate reductase family protein [uncultured Tateyamaria sp.]|uniref:phosphoadenosine phosphosulfate reductase family protein n=1 Tax=uncultured Tateyamaria sp. TaxID=455651 RepID=UPI002607EE8D|nr:phosphoadenosine phosphosulfate reductase family protein [uncultured Tateyamaria sp.]